ncbi:HNH endonuclease [Vibrio parahaemolyticus]
MDTSIKDIVEYWELHQDESGLSVDWAEAETLCWRCAHKRKLQRCHIIPRALGGSEQPSNLVLLCGQCHSEAPNVNDPEFM